MFRTFPFLARVGSRLSGELLPAAIASAVAAILFGHLAKPLTRPPASASPPAVAAAAPAEAEIVFQIVRDDRGNGERDRLAAAPQAPAIEPVADAKPAPAPTAAKPKRLAAKQPSPAKPTADEPKPRQTAAAATQAAPLALPSSEAAVGPPQSLAPPLPPESENFVVATVRDTASAVARIPARVRSSVAGMFSDDSVPRPPADLPADLPQQNLVNASL